MRRVLAREHGQSLVEFALVANIFLLMLFICFQAGVAYFNKLAIEQATRDAARAAVVQSSLQLAGIAPVATDQVLSTASNLDPTKLRAATSVTCRASSKCLPGDDVIVTVSGYPWSIGFGPFTYSGTLSSSTSMRMEG